MLGKNMYSTGLSKPSEKATGYVKNLKEAGTKDTVVLYVSD